MSKKVYDTFSHSVSDAFTPDEIMFVEVQGRLTPFPATADRFEAVKSVTEINLNGLIGQDVELENGDTVNVHGKYINRVSAAEKAAKDEADAKAAADATAQPLEAGTTDSNAPDVPAEPPVNTEPNGDTQPNGS